MRKKKRIIFRVVTSVLACTPQQANNNLKFFLKKKLGADSNVKPKNLGSHL